MILALSRCSQAPAPEYATATRGTIRVVINTNGIVEPVHPTGIYSSIDGFVTSIATGEGSDATRGQVLFRLDATQTRLSLAEARAALLETRRQARTVLEGPAKEELDSLSASIEESRLQLDQVTEDLQAEISLLEKGAVSRESVDRIRKQQDLLRVRTDGLEKKRDNLLSRYSDEDKELMQGKIEELSTQVRLLEQQARDASITSSADGLVYSLNVKPGSYVTRGQLLAQIYQPGQVRLRAYVDEPDLGRIQKGQRVEIEWDGMPNTRWTGAVDTPAERVLRLEIRSVGHVLCSIDGEPGQLLPDINVKIEIITGMKENALLVPRSTVFSHEGASAVLVPDGKQPRIQPVELGLVTYNTVEILRGVEAGDKILTNPGVILGAQ